MAHVDILGPIDLRVDPASGKYLVVEKGGKTPLLKDGKPVSFDPATDTLVFAKGFDGGRGDRPVEIEFFKTQNGGPVPMNKPGDRRPAFLTVENASGSPIEVGGDTSFLFAKGSFVRAVDPTSFARIGFNADKTFMTGKPPVIIKEDDKPHMGFPPGNRVIQFPTTPTTAVLHNDAVGGDGVLYFTSKAPTGPKLLYALKMDDLDTAQKRLNGMVDSVKESVVAAKEAEAAKTPKGKPAPKIPRFTPFPDAQKAAPTGETDRAIFEGRKSGLNTLGAENLALSDGIKLPWSDAKQDASVAVTTPAVPRDVSRTKA